MTDTPEQTRENVREFAKRLEEEIIYCGNPACKKARCIALKSFPETAQLVDWQARRIEDLEGALSLIANQGTDVSPADNEESFVKHALYKDIGTAARALSSQPPFPLSND